MYNLYSLKTIMSVCVCVCVCEGHGLLKVRVKAVLGQK